MGNPYAAPPGSPAMFRTFRSEVEAALSDALSALDLPTRDLGVEEPPEGMDALLASTTSFRLAETVGNSPANIATELAEAVETDQYDYIETVVATGPYVNFHPNEQYYVDTLTTVDEEWGRLPRTDEDVVVEHTSSNPTGPLHVGRGRNTLVGDAIARLLTFAGDDVERHYYVNDAGRQMAVFTWAYENLDEEALPTPERDRGDYDLVRYYRAGHELLKEGDPETVETAEAEISQLIQAMDDGEEEALERVARVVDQVLDGIKTTLRRLPAPFDEFVRETRFIRDGSAAAVVDRLKATDAAKRSDGAWVLDLTEFGIEKDFVFLRSDGTSLYTTRDLAHHEWKFEHFDRAVTVLGEDQQLHAKQLNAALSLLGHESPRLQEVFCSWVGLPGDEGMSTRRGTGVDLDDLLDEAIERARAEVESRLADRSRDDELDRGDIDRIAHQVGIGAVRFGIVAKQRNKEITFEWDQALDFEAQSAPYCQYAHARACGILEGVEDPAGQPDARALSHHVETALIEEIARFPAVVDEASTELEPHQVATYVRTLSDAFNAFYRECPVQRAEGETRTARIALVTAARDTLANALWLLGVAAPESM